MSDLIWGWAVFLALVGYAGLWVYIGFFYARSTGCNGTEGED